MRKLFVSQPMRGKSDETIREERKSIEDFAKDNGYEVIDSVFPDFKAEKGQNIPLVYLGKSLELLSTADAALFMPGWEDYRGCVIEHMACESYGIKVIG
jgi:hypothetical protein